MKRTIQVCYAILIIMMIWSCGTGSEKSNPEKPNPEKVSVISIAELGLQGMLQNPDMDTSYINRIRQVRYFELAMRNWTSKGSYVAYSYDACCPCDSSVVSSDTYVYSNLSGDVCCPCPSNAEQLQYAMSILSMDVWQAKVYLRLADEKTEPTPLESKVENGFQLFSLNGVKDGDYSLTVSGKFTSKPITINVTIQGGKLIYKR